MHEAVAIDSQASRQALPIPMALNSAIGIVAVAIAMACLWLASHAPWPVALAAAVVFSFANNTIFSLLHECVHGCFHSRQRVNDAAGVLFAAFFPTAFTIQRVSHFGHHRRNRTDLELYDYYLPHQSRWLKTYWIYCLLTGFYWAIIPVAGFVCVVCPFAFRSRWFQDGPAKWWGFGEFVRDIGAEPIALVWPEALSTFALQALLWLSLDLGWAGWLACYWAFGLNWSSLQYTDHAFSERDVRNGAWNLRVPWLVRYPRLIKGGSVFDQMILNIDLAPTILDLAGIERPGYMQGRSWKPILEGKDRAGREAWLYEYWWEKAYPYDPTQVGVRTRRYKYIRYPDVGNADPAYPMKAGELPYEELYDLQNDPLEMRNLADAGAGGVMREMRGRLARLVEETGYPGKT